MDRRAFLRVAAVSGAIGALSAGGAIAPASPLGSIGAPLAGARRVIYSYPGATPPPELFDRIRRGIGGVIFFGENITSGGQIADVVRQLTLTALGSGYVLRLFVDQEGGMVKRLPGGPAMSAKQVGAQPDPGAAGGTQGTEAAMALLAAGMNANLAPVMGVYRSEGDFLDQYERSFGMNKETVAQAGSAFIRATQSMGVSACAKHFPGLGAASADENTDLGPVTIDLPEHVLSDIDEFPFRAAVEAGVQMVMPSWAVYPSLDPARPSGMSSEILRGRLRGRLGFRGLIVTDAVEAGALAQYGSTGNRAVTAVDAGVDLLCCSARDVAQGDEAAQALVMAGK
ncbi:glycoside hydrolase family 3 N-terminal domain-containing protein [Hoyosella subflava]|uniref:Glycosyl hydrolase family 3 N terminal domain protein n=1 Tax=Hoyosella subflava (strain DSM 45089 / JCM 17490 / NBRC 109087 / DQS3-9A1) TaxID=443218 RepID=F6ERX0_HOYSD|nr:glycoside hydrolase family 3 N-terminal domain-containing protein [Hoyosella subflava]AEF40785.1 Glycosyl hydrolase family 3 N terminal domain protein [Hoyosella subflava DQS3-9A1]